MRCLVDTHTLLWWITSPEELPQSLLDLLDDRSNDLLLSIATPWELAIKTNTGKLNATQILRDLETGRLAEDMDILPTTVSHAIKASLLPLHHRDPFDRLLAAQALELRIPILSRSRIFDRYGVKRIWD